MFGGWFALLVQTGNDLGFEASEKLGGAATDLLFMCKGQFGIRLTIKNRSNVIIERKWSSYREFKRVDFVAYQIYLGHFLFSVKVDHNVLYIFIIVEFNRLLLGILNDDRVLKSKLLVEILASLKIEVSVLKRYLNAIKTGSNVFSVKIRSIC
jgi:hypothetical protein